MTDRKKFELNNSEEALLVLNVAPDHIWAMGHADGIIGLRFDDGDAGYVPLTIDQAQEVIETLQYMIAEMAAAESSSPKGTDGSK